MFKDLLINMAFIVSFISIGSQLFKKREINRASSIKSKITLGIINGLLGITLIIFGMHVNQSTIIDLRNVTLAMSAIHGGTVPLIICGLMIAVFRVVHFGVNTSSVYGVISVIVLVVGCGFISRFKIRSYKKWIYSTLFNLSVSSVLITILLKGKTNLLVLFSAYWLMTIIISFIVYYYIDYCLTANSLFRKLQRESTKDFLTGLNNVRQFNSMFNYAIDNAREKKENLSLLMVDIDFFKKVNDTHGHHEGDIVLKELANILSKNCRSFDIISRNGGEEFTALLLDCPKTNALQTAERIRASVEVHPFILSDGKQIAVTVSIGVASYPEITKEVERLLEEADIGLYVAKRTGRNKVCTGNKCSV